MITEPLILRQVTDGIVMPSFLSEDVILGNTEIYSECGDPYLIETEILEFASVVEIIDDATAIGYAP